MTATTTEERYKQILSLLDTHLEEVVVLNNWIRHDLPQLIKIYKTNIQDRQNIYKKIILFFVHGKDAFTISKYNLYLIKSDNKNNFVCNKIIYLEKLSFPIYLHGSFTVCPNLPKFQWKFRIDNVNSQIWIGIKNHSSFFKVRYFIELNNNEDIKFYREEYCPDPRAVGQQTYIMRHIEPTVGMIIDILLDNTCQHLTFTINNKSRMVFERTCLRRYKLFVTINPSQHLNKLTLQESSYI